MAKENQIPKDSSSGPKNFRAIWIYYLLIGFFFFIWLYRGSDSLTELDWHRFESEMLSSGDVEKLVVVNKEKVEVFIYEDSLQEPQYADAYREENVFAGEGPKYFFNIGSVEVFYEQLEKAESEFLGGENIPVSYTTRENWIGSILSWILPFVLLIFFWFFLLRRMAQGSGGGASGLWNFGKTQARFAQKEEGKQVTFQDVAGLEEAKEEIYELVRFLKFPERYRYLGAKIPKGILLLGPPGTGKTLLAKAVAGEAGVPFLSLSGSEFIEMFVGVGAARVRDLFKKAKGCAPSIVFIDEIDTIGRARSSTRFFNDSDERDSTLNQLLAELDGFDTNTGVIVLAATNRGDVLDPALLRPGRFDRHIQLELPTFSEREAIFKVHLKPLKIDGEVTADFLAAQTPGFSGADIANTCNEAALLAAHKEKEAVFKEDFLNAIDRLVGGMEKKSKIISSQEKNRVAYHEAGHVVASWFLEHSHSVQKVSIIPRGRSLGAAWYLPEEHNIITKSEFFDALCTALGGRAAEEIVFEETSSNAMDDLEKVTKQAYNMVVNYGLSDSLKNLSFYDSTGKNQQFLQKPYSENTAEIIDKEVRELIEKAFERTKSVLIDHREQLDQLAAALIEKEILQKEEIQEILGEKLH